MLQTIFMLYGITLLLDGVLMKILTAKVKKGQGENILHDPKKNRISDFNRKTNVMLNSAWSMLFLTGMIYFFHGYLVHESTGFNVIKIFGEVALTLFLYDFIYYWLHRLMHVPEILKMIHGVHHRIISPSAFESIYLNPIENTAGLTTLLVSTMIVGPVHFISFALIFLIHSSLNIIVHSGYVFPGGILKPINFIARNHEVHHGVNPRKNYAQLLPLWDHVFNTFMAPKVASKVASKKANS